jgi:hypothetical protein
LSFQVIVSVSDLLRDGYSFILTAQDLTSKREIRQRTT